jgi:rubrerythrin
MTTRRHFLHLAGLTGAGLLVACGDDAPPPGADENREPSDPDVELLNAALDLENTAIAAYTAGAGLLRGPLLRVGRQLLAHEEEHADRLTQAIRDLGGTPNEPKSAREYARSFPALKTEADVLRFAVDLENVAVRTYLDAIRKLSSGELRQTAAAIVSNEAEHISVLLGATNPNRPARQVPGAFVTGVATT